MDDGFSACNASRTSPMGRFHEAIGMIPQFFHIIAVMMAGTGCFVFPRMCLGMEFVFARLVSAPNGRGFRQYPASPLSLSDA